MLSVIPEDRSKDAWIAATWKQEWEASGPHPSTLPRIGSRRRRQWRRSELKILSTLNRLRTVVGRYKASTKKWGLADSAACECEQNRKLTT